LSKISATTSSSSRFSLRTSLTPSLAASRTVPPGQQLLARFEEVSNPAVLQVDGDVFAAAAELADARSSGGWDPQSVS